MIRIEKEGYQTIQEPLDLTIGGQLVKEWTMVQGETVSDTLAAVLKTEIDLSTLPKNTPAG